MRSIPLPGRRAALLLLAAGAAAVVLVLFMARGAGPVAAAADPADADRTVEVTGTGTVDVAPDRAVLSVGVERDADGREAARAAAAADLSRLLDALRGAGVAPEHLQSDGLQVEPRYSDDAETRVIGYRARAAVDVTLDDLDRVGPVIDAAADAGAARVEGVTWTVRDPGAARRQALAAAAADGRSQAEALARGAGVGLGALQRMEVADGGAEPPVAEADMRAASAAPSAPTPVAPGTLSAAVSVSMTFALA